MMLTSTIVFSEFVTSHKKKRNRNYREGQKCPSFFYKYYMVVILRRKELVFVGITYYMPDYTNILQEFHWQTEDIVPDIPRVHEFLNYWKQNIIATIKEIEVNSSFQGNYKNAIFHKILN